ncbi:hypothetical protein TRFO_40239 [Tritrichomonas foetus]|uniref:Protein kinase domain-containing protein n=1 Tax=Tritrichomonas foetus TaxID=1144522 RepID=A0A1J4J8C0_9EUKA|nr:hypothetical protein TRFO_40239 [Tritrichomonas foetus]|eukprot:OHS93484.1 hypothetical protein TRFO_40239 [Tritrichomonas foetus]
MEDFSTAYQIEKPYFTEDFMTVQIVHDKSNQKYFAVDHSKNEEAKNSTEKIKSLYDRFEHFSGIHKLHSIAHDSEKNIDYFIYEYSQNGFLLSHVKDEKIDDKAKYQIMLKLSEILLFFHSQNLVIRDLSLSNIILDEDNNPKIWSLAYCCNAGDTVKTFSTFPHILPPELPHLEYQASKEQDLWTLGASFMMLLGGNFAPLFMSLRVNVPSSAFRPVFPKELSEPIKELLQKILGKPEERGSAQELNDYLKNIEIHD